MLIHRRARRSTQPLGGRDNEGELERRSALSACAPQRSNDDVDCAERVVQVAAQLPDVETSQVGHRGLRVGGSSSGEEGQDFDGLFEFNSEETLVVSVLKPPGPLAVDVVLAVSVKRTRRGFNSIAAA